MFAVAERCQAFLDVHFAPEFEPNLIEEVLDQARVESLDRHNGCELITKKLYSSRGYQVDPTSPALAPVRAAFAELGRDFRSARFRSHSDASPLFRKGTIPLVCGPGMLEVAPHTRRTRSADTGSSGSRTLRFNLLRRLLLTAIQ